MIVNSSKSLIFSFLFFFALLLKDRGNLASTDYVTQKIYGFLDFTTTVGNTVMIFSPHSTKEISSKSTQSTLMEITSSSNKPIIETSPINSHYKTSIEASKTIKHEPETADLKHKTSNTNSLRRTNFVTGLVTKTEETIVNKNLTTVHETSVIGTYISGKYAQILQSSSTVYPNKRVEAEQFSQTLPVEPLFSTLESAINPTKRLTLSGYSLNSSNINLGKKTKPISKVNENGIPTISSTENLYNKKRPKFGQNSRLIKKNLETVTSTSTPISTTKKFQPKRNGKSKTPQNDTITKKNGFKPKLPNAPAASTQSSVSSLSSASNFIPKLKLNRESGRWHYKTSPKPRVNIRRQLPQTFAEHLTSTTTSKLTSTESISEDISNDLEISQARGGFDSFIESSDNNVIDKIDEEEHENQVESVGSNVTPKIDKKFPVETINVNITISPESDDIYYEIATIKTPYVFQVGTVKNTRYITVTSTSTKSFHEVEKTIPNFDFQPQKPLTENILATNNQDTQSTESSLTSSQLLAESELITLKPIFVMNRHGESNVIPTPPLETISETITTTQNVLKTHILPIVYQTENNLINVTSSLTLLQTYHVTRVISATKTVAIMEVDQLNDENQHLDEAGSEHLPQVDFGDENGADKQRLTSDNGDLKEIDADFDLGAIDEKRVRLLVTKRRLKTSKLVENVNNNNIIENNNKFLFPQVAQNFVTISKPVVKVETVYDTKVVPLVLKNGQQTSYTTISRPIGTFSKTEFEYTTLASPLSNQLQLPVQNQIQPHPQPPPQPYIPQAIFSPQFTITSTPIVSQTLHTQTNSKVLKLTFGARTTMTTIFSTKVIPTLVTSYITTSIPIQNGVQNNLFPGYYPFSGYPFLG